jgi:DNA-binding FadR family transcriptional regulator
VPPPPTPFSQWPERLETTVEELLQIRLLIEPPAAAMAAVSDVDVKTKAATLREPLERMRLAIEEDALERRVAADLTFHLAIAELSQNRIVLGMLRELGGLLVESRRISLSYDERLEIVQSAHEAICDAILAGDPAGAAQAMSEHLTRFADDMGLAGTALVVPAGPAAVTDVSRLTEFSWVERGGARTA